jgi:hypothetical protein
VLELFVPHRIAVPDLRLTVPSAPRRPSRCDSPSSRRYRTRARKLTAEHEAAIRSFASTKSLRSLAADFGVSHETIRAVIRLRASACIPYCEE